LMTTNAGHNTHGSLQQINGQWYVFYHRPPRGFGYARQAMVAPVKITWDKKPVAKGGVVKITAYDPYTKDNVWTAKATDGTEYTGAEVTSEGFQIFGLPPYQYYSAGLACWMSGGTNSNEWMQDNFDVWNNSMDLAGITNGGIIGFKYFGFGGLAESKLGIPAFEGIKKGDNAHLYLNLTYSGKGAFNIHVKLDDPWKGKELGIIYVGDKTPTNQAVTISHLVPDVEGLTGKHAIFLVVEGPEVAQPQNNRPQWGRQQQPQRPQGLFDLHGIGFTKTDACPVPMVPQITIKCDGKELLVPNLPIRSTNQNGYTDLTHYQVYGPLKNNSKLEVTSNAPDGVQITVSPITEGRATVKCVYRGKEKIFLIN